jgi:phasin family protein
VDMLVHIYLGMIEPLRAPRKSPDHSLLREDIMANLITGREGFVDPKALGAFRIPGIEVVGASQFKNIEALAQANQFAVEGAHAVLRRQIEIVGQAIDEFSAIVRTFGQPNGSPEDRLAKQAEFTKLWIEKGLANARELTELVTKANTEVFSVISKRMTESLEEARDYAKQPVAAH